MKAERFFPLIVVAAGLLAYGNSFSIPFLFDDDTSVLLNPTIRQLSTALQPPAAAGVGGRPLVNLTFAANYALGGLNVTGYHAANVAIHILAGLTLLGILRRTFDPTTALSATLIWLVHPVQTGAVNYISQRSEILMGLFYLLTLYCFVRGWPALAVAACWLGALTKEVIVTAPVMVLLYDRVFVAGSFRAAWEKRKGFYLALAGSWVVLACLMAGLQHRGVGFNAGVSPWNYALTECGAIVHYLRLVFWPDPLVFDYGTDVVKRAADVAPQLAMLAALVAGILVCRRRWPAISFAGVWFLVILAPTSSFVPVAGSPMAEHRLYLPLAGLVTAIVAGAFAAGRRKLATALAGVVAVAFAGLTIRRNYDYRSEIALWQDTADKRPANPRAHYNLGVALFLSGRAEEAVARYESALRLEPDYVDAHNNLAWILATDGNERLRDAGRAVRHAERACELNGRRDAGLLDTLAAAYATAGSFDDAVRVAQEAISKAGDETLAGEIRARLELYQAGQPFRR